MSRFSLLSRLRGVAAMFAPGRRSLARHVWPCALIVALFTSTMATAEVVGPFTLEAALSAAEARSQALLAQAAAIRALSERAAAADQLPDPSLQLSLNNLPTEGDVAFRTGAEAMTMRSVGVMQTFSSAGKRHALKTRLEREADIATAERSMTLVELRKQTALAWLRLYFQQRILAHTVALRDAAGREVTAAEAAFRGGQGIEADVFAARLALAQLDDRLRALRAELANAEAALARWTGPVPTADLSALPDIDKSLLAQHQLDHQVDLHPEIARMIAAEHAALADAEVARQEKRADWTWSLMYGERGAGYSDVVSLGVSVPLQWNRKNRQNRELAAELARVDQARAQTEEMRRAHILELAQLLRLWQVQLARLEHYDTTLLPLAAQRTQAVLTSYRGNRAPLSAVLEARRMEVEVQIDRLRIEEEAAELWAELEFGIPDLAAMAANTNETTFTTQEPGQ